MSDLIIGGTSGLGLELARNFNSQGREVIVTGRTDPGIDFAKFEKLDLSVHNLADVIDDLIHELPPINTLVYVAGYYQEGTITDLTDEQIEEMINVGGRGLIYTVKSILAKQDNLPELITITSTSQWTPRKLEPIYNFVKAGAGHFTNSMAEDGRVAKVMVAGPAGMNTDFWEDQPDRDKSTLLDAGWVAEQIMAARQDNYAYKNIRILREPARVEEVETR